MAKKEYVTLYQIGKTPAGETIELDEREAKRLYRAKAIATREELNKRNQVAPGNADTAELEQAVKDRDTRIEELEKQLEEDGNTLKETAKVAEEAETKVAELEKQLEASQGQVAELQKAVEASKAQGSGKGGK